MNSLSHIRELSLHRKDSSFFAFQPSSE
uniref:Uncharacterized protein n=1 Tax=Lepeophtheirus salmonis TaxID=72036 RepID=A0A0K2UXG5_LEPSM